MAELDDWITPTASVSASVDDWITPSRAREREREPVDDWVTPTRVQTPESRPEPQSAPEGIFATGLREAAHGALPAAGAAAGAMYGAGIGSALGPIGSIGGGLIGAIAGGFGTSAVQEEGLKLLGADDSIQRAVNAKTNPWSAAAGTAVSTAAGFGAGAVPMAARIGSAAISGLGEAGVQAYQGEFDPARLVGSTVAGAALAKSYSWGSRLEAQGAALGERLRPKVEPHGSAGPESSVGIAEQATPATRAENQTGDPQNKVTRSERDYPAAGTEPAAPGGGVHVGEVDPTLKAALDAKIADTAPPPVEAPPAAEPQRPLMTAPAEDARVTPEMAAPAAPREAIKQPAPDTTVGGALREAAAGRRQDVIRGPEPGAAEKAVKLEPVSVEWATQMWGGDLPESGGGGGQQHFIIRNAAGEPEALAAISIKGKKANIDNIELLDEQISGSTRRLTTIFPGDPQNLLGLSVIRGALREFRKAHPEITEITGLRVSGARFGGESVSREEGSNVGVKLRVEAAKRGMTPEALEAQAREAVMPPAGSGAQGPPGGPPGAPPTGVPPPEPPLSAAQQLGQQGKRTLDQLKNIFAPQTRGPQARELATQIRGAYGETTRLNAQTQDILNKHRDTVNAMSQDDLRALVNRAQGGNAFPDWKPDPAQRSFLTDIKRATDMWSSKLGTLDRAKQMDWIENYLPGMYKNPQANQQFFQDTARRQGGAGSLKQKMFPDYEAARAAGLEPHTNNPIEMLELYGSQMRNFIGKQEVMEKGLKSGLFIKSQAPERIGAAGSPEPQVKSNLPPNYIESRTTPGMYMPEEVAHVWDNFNSAGLAGGRNKDVYGALRSANALWTNLELSLNGYHAFTMANESFISDVAMGLEKIAGGKVASGLKTIAQAPTAPYSRAKLGSKVQQSYLDPNSTDPITQSLVKAGFRPIGRSHAADSMLGQKTFLDSFKDLPKQLKQAASETQQGWTDANGDLLKQVAYPFRLAQRAIATVSHPLFEVYIPKLKAGAAYAQMEHWREFNPDKIGTVVETEAARKIVDSVDNRFGEMITDHLFMNKVVQDMGVAGMRSFSWFMGSMKEIGGGTYSGARAVARAAIERDPSRLGVLNPSNKNYDPRTAYAVAMPMVIAATSAMYQALLGSHDAPESWRDLYAPRTGGMVVGPGGSRVQEHMLMPGYHKDVYGWLAHPGGEAYNKLSGVWSTAIEEARGRGSPSVGSPPIIRPNASFTENVTDRMSYLFSKLGPIGAKAFLKGQKEGSEIPSTMAAIGFHPPGMEIQAPEKIHAIQAKQEKREWKTMTKRANKDAMSRGQPLPYPYRTAEDMP